MQQRYEARLIRVLDHIHDNPGGDLSLDALADVAAMSRFHWHRVFRALTGETVAQAVRRIRLTRAACDLVRTTQPVARIAASVGYPNAASFSRAFADAYGLPPLAFRQRGVMPPDTTQTPERKDLMFPVTLTTRPPTRLAAIPHRGSFMQINRAFNTLSATFEARGLMAQVQGMIAVFYDNPAETPEPDLRSHAGFVVSDDFAITPPLEEVNLAAGRYAVLAHRGAYATLPEAYDQLFCGWLPGSGEEPADAPSFEHYLNSPMDSAPDDLRTDIYLPLKG